MDTDMKKLTNFLVNLGVEKVGHSGKTYLAPPDRRLPPHGRSRLRRRTLPQAGMFHSIYGTQQFQGFKLALDQRPQVRDLIGERAEQLGYLNCAMDRASLDRAVEQGEGPYRITDRLTGQQVELSPGDFDDLCRVHLYDWLEQVPRSRLGWGYRRDAYRRMSTRLGPVARRRL